MGFPGRPKKQSHKRRLARPKLQKCGQTKTTPTPAPCWGRDSPARRARTVEVSMMSRAVAVFTPHSDLNVAPKELSLPRPGVRVGVVFCSPIEIQKQKDRKSGASGSICAYEPGDEPPDTGLCCGTWKKHLCCRKTVRSWLVTLVRVPCKVLAVRLWNAAWPHNLTARPHKAPSQAS